MPFAVGRALQVNGAFLCIAESQLHILFVCTGNICRSPMAERLAIAFVAQFGIPGITVSSAGTRAVIAHPIHARAALVLEGLGGDASEFAARQLTPKIAAGADLILAMTRVHREMVLEAAPRQLHKTFTLSEAACLAVDPNAQTVTDLVALRPHVALAAAADIADPIGRSPEFFEMIGSQIADLLPPILRVCERSIAAAGLTRGDVDSMRIAHSAPNGPRTLPTHHSR